MRHATRGEGASKMYYSNSFKVKGGNESAFFVALYTEKGKGRPVIVSEAHKTFEAARRAIPGTICRLHGIVGASIINVSAKESIIGDWNEVTSD